MFSRYKNDIISSPLSSHLKRLFPLITTLRTSKLYIIYIVFITNVVFGCGVGGGGVLVVLVVAAVLLLLMVVVVVLVVVVC